LKKQIQFSNQAVSLNTSVNSQVPQRSEEPLPEHDFEMSPSSPTLLLRNIEKQVCRVLALRNNFRYIFAS
jgi:hypothetical protein